MENGLVKGYMTYRFVDNMILETLYFVEDNKAYQSKEQPRTNKFSGRKWTLMTRSADWVRDNAEFIGNYVRPANI